MHNPARHVISTALAVIYFTGQVVLGSAAESNLWAERRRNTTAKQPTPPQQFAALPNSFLSQLPTVSRALPLAQAAGAFSKPTGKLSRKLKDLIAAVPAANGSVQDVYDSYDLYDLEDKQAAPVVLIQDVHLNAEAQNNIAVLLQELINQKKVGVVGVEGAFGEFDFKPFREFPDKKIAQDVSAAFLNNNLLAAPSYVGITSPQEPPLFIGVDDRTHYDANVQAYLDSRPLKEHITQELTKQAAELRDAKQKTFSPALLQFDNDRTAYADGTLGLGIYVKKLSTMIPSPLAGEGRVRASFVLDQFLAAYDLETHLDFPRVEAERKTVLEKLTKTLTEKETSTLLAQSLAYRMGKINFGAYYQNLKNLCAEKGISLRQTPAFDNYIRYVLLADGIKADKLFAAVRNLEEKILRQLATTDQEKNLAAASERLTLTKKLVEFSLTPDEWERYKLLKHEPQEKRLVPFETFYEQADIRSEKMAETLISKSQTLNSKQIQNPNTPVLVCGGFHTPQIAQFLRAKKIPYLVLSPKITKIDTANGSEYLSVFAREKTPLDKLFQGEKLFLSPRDIQITEPRGGIPPLATMWLKLKNINPVPLFWKNMRLQITVPKNFLAVDQYAISKPWWQVAGAAVAVLAEAASNYFFGSLFESTTIGFIWAALLGAALPFFHERSTLVKNKYVSSALTLSVTFLIAAMLVPLNLTLAVKLMGYSETLMLPTLIAAGIMGALLQGLFFAWSNRVMVMSRSGGRVATRALGFGGTLAAFFLSLGLLSDPRRDAVPVSDGKTTAYVIGAQNADEVRYVQDTLEFFPKKLPKTGIIQFHAGNSMHGMTYRLADLPGGIVGDAFFISIAHINPTGADITIRPQMRSVLSHELMHVTVKSRSIFAREFKRLWTLNNPHLKNDPRTNDNECWTTETQLLFSNMDMFLDTTDGLQRVTPGMRLLILKEEVTYKNGRAYVPIFYNDEFLGNVQLQFDEPVEEIFRKLREQVKILASGSTAGHIADGKALIDAFMSRHREKLDPQSKISPLAPDLEKRLAVFDEVFAQPNLSHRTTPMYLFINPRGQCSLDLINVLPHTDTTLPSVEKISIVLALSSIYGLHGELALEKIPELKDAIFEKMGNMENKASRATENEIFRALDDASVRIDRWRTTAHQPTPQEIAAIRNAMNRARERTTPNNKPGARTPASLLDPVLKLFGLTETSPAYRKYTIVGAAVWETIVFHFLGYRGLVSAFKYYGADPTNSILLAVVALAFIFAAAHTIVAWLVRAYEDGGDAWRKLPQDFASFLLRFLFSFVVSLPFLFVMLLPVSLPLLAQWILLTIAVLPAAYLQGKFNQMKLEGNLPSRAPIMSIVPSKGSTGVKSLVSPEKGKLDPESLEAVGHKKRFEKLRTQQWRGILTDIDGTITDSNRNVPDAVIKWIVSNLEKRVRVGLVSARPYKLENKTNGWRDIKEVEDKIRAAFGDDPEGLVDSYLDVFPETASYGFSVGNPEKKYDFGIQPVLFNEHVPEKIKKDPRFGAYVFHGYSGFVQVINPKQVGLWKVLGRFFPWVGKIKWLTSYMQPLPDFNAKLRDELRKELIGFFPNIPIDPQWVGDGFVIQQQGARKERASEVYDHLLNGQYISTDDRGRRGENGEGLVNRDGGIAIQHYEPTDEQMTAAVLLWPDMSNVDRWLTVMNQLNFVGGTAPAMSHKESNSPGQGLLYRPAWASHGDGKQKIWDFGIGPLWEEAAIIGLTLLLGQALVYVALRIFFVAGHKWRGPPSERAALVISVLTLLAVGSLTGWTPNLSTLTLQQKVIAGILSVAIHAAVNRFFAAKTLTESPRQQMKVKDHLSHDPEHVSDLRNVEADANALTRILLASFQSGSTDPDAEAQRWRREMLGGVEKFYGSDQTAFLKWTADSQTAATWEMLASFFEDVFRANADKLGLTLQEYANFLGGDNPAAQAERDRLRKVVAVADTWGQGNTSGFFRGADKWGLVNKEPLTPNSLLEKWNYKKGFLPDLLRHEWKQKKEGERVVYRGRHLPSSTGQEVYSHASFLYNSLVDLYLEQDGVPDRVLFQQWVTKNWDIRLDAFDISISSLMVLKKGIFSSAGRGVWGEANNLLLPKSKEEPSSSVQQIDPFILNWIRPQFLDATDPKQLQCLTQEKYHVTFSQRLLGFWGTAGWEKYPQIMDALLDPKGQADWHKIILAQNNSDHNDVIFSVDHNDGEQQLTPAAMAVRDENLKRMKGGDNPLALEYWEWAFWAALAQPDDETLLKRLAAAPTPAAQRLGEWLLARNATNSKFTILPANVVLALADRNMLWDHARLWLLLNVANIDPDVVPGKVDFAILEFIFNALDVTVQQYKVSREKAAELIRVSVGLVATDDPLKKDLVIRVSNPRRMESNIMSPEQLSVHAEILEAMLHFERKPGTPYPNPNGRDFKRIILEHAGLNDDQIRAFDEMRLDIQSGKAAFLKVHHKELVKTLAAIHLALDHWKPGTVIKLRPFLSSKTAQFINAYFGMAAPIKNGRGKVVRYTLANQIIFSDRFGLNGIGRNAGTGLATAMKNARKDGYKVRPPENSGEHTVATIRIPHEKLNFSSPHSRERGVYTLAYVEKKYRSRQRLQRLMDEVESQNRSALMLYFGLLGLNRSATQDFQDSARTLQLTNDITAHKLDQMRDKKILVIGVEPNDPLLKLLVDKLEFSKANIVVLDPSSPQSMQDLRSNEFQWCLTTNDFRAEGAPTADNAGESIARDLASKGRLVLLKNPYDIFTEEEAPASSRRVSSWQWASELSRLQLLLIGLGLLIIARAAWGLFSPYDITSGLWMLAGLGMISSLKEEDFLAQLNPLKVDDTTKHEITNYLAPHLIFDPLSDEEIVGALKILFRSLRMDSKIPRFITEKDFTEMMAVYIDYHFSLAEAVQAINDSAGVWETTDHKKEKPAGFARTLASGGKKWFAVRLWFAQGTEKNYETPAREEILSDPEIREVSEKFEEALARIPNDSQAITQAGELFNNLVARLAARSAPSDQAMRNRIITRNLFRLLKQARISTENQWGKIKKYIDPIDRHEESMPTPSKLLPPLAKKSSFDPSHETFVRQWDENLAAWENRLDALWDIYEAWRATAVQLRNTIDLDKLKPTMSAVESGVFATLMDRLKVNETVTNDRAISRFNGTRNDFESMYQAYMDLAKTTDERLLDYFNAVLDACFREKSRLTYIISDYDDDRGRLSPSLLAEKYKLSREQMRAKEEQLAKQIVDLRAQIDTTKERAKYIREKAQALRTGQPRPSPSRPRAPPRIVTKQALAKARKYGSTVPKKDLYEILGIARDADSKAIKQAYRGKAKKDHPDTDEGEKTKFLETHTAYEILSDENELRPVYDRFGRSAFGSAPSSLLDLFLQAFLNAPAKTKKDFLLWRLFPETMGLWWAVANITDPSMLWLGAGMFLVSHFFLRLELVRQGKISAWLLIFGAVSDLLVLALYAKMPWTFLAIPLHFMIDLAWRKWAAARQKQIDADNETDPSSQRDTLSPKETILNLLWGSPTIRIKLEPGRPVQLGIPGDPYLKLSLEEAPAGTTSRRVRIDYSSEATRYLTRYGHEDYFLPLNSMPIAFGRAETSDWPVPARHHVLNWGSLPLYHFELQCKAADGEVWLTVRNLAFDHPTRIDLPKGMQYEDEAPQRLISPEKLKIDELLKEAEVFLRQSVTADMHVQKRVGSLIGYLQYLHTTPLTHSEEDIPRYVNIALAFQELRALMDQRFQGRIPAELPSVLQIRNLTLLESSTPDARTQNQTFSFFLDNHPDYLVDVTLTPRNEMFLVGVRWQDPDDDAAAPVMTPFTGRNMGIVKSINHLVLLHLQGDLSIADEGGDGVSLRFKQKGVPKSIWIRIPKNANRPRSLEVEGDENALFSVLGPLLGSKAIASAITYFGVDPTFSTFLAVSLLLALIFAVAPRSSAGAVLDKDVFRGEEPRTTSLPADMVVDMARNILDGKTADEIAGLLERSPISVGDMRGQNKGPAVLMDLQQALKDPRFITELQTKLASLKNERPGLDWSDDHQQILFDALQTLGFNGAAIKSIMTRINPTDLHIIAIDEELGAQIKSDPAGYVLEELRRLKATSDTPVLILTSPVLTGYDDVPKKLELQFPRLTVSNELVKTKEVESIQRLASAKSATNTMMLVCPEWMENQMSGWEPLKNKIISHEKLLPPTQFFDIGGIAKRLHAILEAA